MQSLDHENGNLVNPAASFVYHDTAGVHGLEQLASALAGEDFEAATLAQVLRENLATSLLEQIELYKEGLPNSYSCLYITELPTDPDTLGAVTLGFGSLLGTPYLEAEEADSIVQDVQPEPAKARSQTSKSSEVELYLHTENVGMAHVPDWVILACIRNNEAAATLVSDPQRVISKMFDDGNLDAYYRLLDDAFWVLEPEIFAERAGRDRRKGSELMPVFVTGYPFSNVNADLEAMGSDSEEHQAALKLFGVYARQMAVPIVLKPGSLLAIRNTSSRQGFEYHSALHGRASFVADYSEPRWLKRLYVTEDTYNED